MVKPKRANTMLRSNFMVVNIGNNFTSPHGNFRAKVGRFKCFEVGMLAGLYVLSLNKNIT
jgi:hypothetical protein